ncbi:MAG: zinc-binding alcohol dehydrogenase [Anaerolineales bacterium]
MRALYFKAPRQLEIRVEHLPALIPGQVLVKTLVSAISPGTEMLVYRGEMPQDAPTDANIAALAGEMRYPLKYGYAAVGQVIDIGDPTLAGWQNRIVFSFQPHQTHFLAPPDHLIPLPEGIAPEQGIFLPNMETAVNFVMDGQPLLGERVAIFGQGIVGLLTTALLAQFPLAHLTTFDHFPLRRKASLDAGANSSHSPDSLQAPLDSHKFPSYFDLTYELTGSPHALNDAIAVTGFDGRVVIGSWYGQKRAPLDLGGYFHRSRIRLISSQVSTLAPQFTGRWDKARRFEMAWEMIRRVRPERWITQEFSFEHAEGAYALIDQKSETAIQVILNYS